MADGDLTSLSVANHGDKEHGPHGSIPQKCSGRDFCVLIQLSCTKKESKIIHTTLVRGM